jgi:hypothetical protein
MTDQTQEDVKSRRKQKEEPDFVPVLLKRNYRPVADFFVERDGEIQEPGVNEDGHFDRDKVKAGTTIHVPRDEARRALKHGIAERADEL